MLRPLHPAPTLRAAALGRSLLVVLLAAACNSPAGPQPQRATFPPGERTARTGPVALELAEAHYDLRQVSLKVSLTNRGKAPLSIERDGILLAYGELEFPVLPSDTKPVAELTTLPPGATVQLELGFGTEQLMIEAATLQLLSIHAGDDWLAPLRLTVPPPAAFVEAAAQPEEEP